MPDVDRVMRAYPHQLSGGMLQRAMIATALLCRPRLLIADEPTTALDVTIAAQILALLRRLQREEGFSVMLITHDLGVVRTVCDRVAVLYAGRVVETAPTEALFAAPQHPYTRGLLAAVPRTAAVAGPLRTIPGSVPADIGAITGCAFAARCPIAVDRCRVEAPALRARRRRSARRHATSRGYRDDPCAEWLPPTGPPAPAPLVRIEGLVKEFPVHVPGRGTVDHPGRQRGRPGHRGRRGVRAGRRVGFRQDDARAVPAASGRRRRRVASRWPGRDVTRAAGGDLRALRREMQVVFQDPVGSLDPRSRVQDVVAEPLRTHLRMSPREVTARVIELLDEVGLCADAT